LHLVEFADDAVQIPPLHHRTEGERGPFPQLESDGDPVDAFHQPAVVGSRENEAVVLLYGVRGFDQD